MTKQKKVATKPAMGAKPRGPAPKAGSSTKLAQLETMLRQSLGVTIFQLAKALDWRPHSVRAAMSRI